MIDKRWKERKRRRKVKKKLWQKERMKKDKMESMKEREEGNL